MNRHYYEVTALTHSGQNFVNTYFVGDYCQAIAVARRKAIKNGDPIKHGSETVRRHEEK